MNDANLAKEKLKTLTEELRVEWELTKEKDEQLAAAKERIKGIVAKAVEGFQQTEEYKSSATETDAPENALDTDSAAADAWTQHSEEKKNFFPPPFFLCPLCFRAFCKSNFGTVFPLVLFWEQHYLPSFYGPLNVENNGNCPLFLGFN